MQQAFYVDGLSLSDPETYVRISRSHHLDDAAVIARLDTPATAAAAKADFERSRSLGVSAFPTLLVPTSTGTARLGGPTSTRASLRPHWISTGAPPLSAPDQPVPLLDPPDQPTQLRTQQ